jgi:hypothetical protein
MEASLKERGIRLSVEELRLANLDIWNIARLMGLTSEKPYTKHFGFAERQMLALEQGILNLKKPPYNLNETEIGNIQENMKLIVSVSREIEDNLIKIFTAPSRISGKHFFGFNPLNVVFVNGGYGPAFRFHEP